jgi:predicted AAA+ superfamily ATPase
MLTLLPFSLGELADAGRAPINLDGLLFSGLYPPIHDRRFEPSPWYGNYVATYVERDVRQVLQVKDLSRFQRFVQLCAGRTGQLVNFSSLAMDAGISQPTAAGWLSVMQAAHLVYLLKPHHRSFDKRLIKTPKLYFLDTGLACRLMGITSAEHLSIHPMRGALFESWAIAELLKARLHQARPDDLYFWRDRSGHEVDVLLTAFRESRSVGTGVPPNPSDRLVPVEVKSGRTIAGDWTAGLGWWGRLAGDEAGAPWLVYGGDTSFERSGVRHVGWRDLPGSGLL